MQQLQKSVRQRVEALLDDIERLRQLDAEIDRLVDEADLAAWDHALGLTGHFLDARLSLTDARNIENAITADLFALTDEAGDSIDGFARSDLTAGAVSWILMNEEERWLLPKIAFAKALLDAKRERAIGQLLRQAQAFLNARDELVRTWRIQRCRQLAAHRPHAAVLRLSLSERMVSPPVLFFFHNSDAKVYAELKGFLRVWGIQTKSYLDDETGGNIERWIEHETPRAEKIVFISSLRYKNSPYEDQETRLAFEIEHAQGGDIVFLLARDAHIPARLEKLRGRWEYFSDARSRDQARRALLRAWGFPIPKDAPFSPRLYRPRQNGARRVGVLCGEDLDPDGLVSAIKAHGIEVVTATAAMPDPRPGPVVRVVVSTLGALGSSELAKHGWRGVQVLTYRKGALQDLIDRLESTFNGRRARKPPASG